MTNELKQRVTRKKDQLGDICVLSPEIAINRASNRLLYEQGASLIKNFIKTQNLKKGAKLPSIRHLANHLNVSQNTVCRILQSLENEGVIYRVHGKGTFVNIDLISAYSILCLIDHFYPQAGHDSYVHDIIAANQHWFSSNNHQYTVKVLNDNMLVPLDPTAILGTPKPAGIVLGMKLADKWIRLAEQTGLPTVILNRNWPRNSVSSVVPDNVKGAKQICEHLWQLGHRRIAILCSIHPYETNTIERRDAMVEYWRTRVSDNNVGVWNIDYSDLDKVDANYDFALMEIIAHFKPTAIIGCNDYSAWHAYENVKRVGKRIPDDISVVGFQDIALAAQLKPALTTVRVDTENMGKLAAEHLDSCIQDREQAGKIIRSPVQLIVRNSTSEIRNYM